MPISLSYTTLVRARRRGRTSSTMMLNRASLVRTSGMVAPPAGVLSRA